MVCLILSKTHLNHEIAETDKKKITKIQIRIRKPFKIHLDFFGCAFLLIFLASERLEDENFLDFMIEKV